MSAPVKKAAETVAKAAVKSTAPKAAAAQITSSLKGKTVGPASSAADDQSSMPWEGWFSSFLRSKLGTERYDSLRNTVLYRPDDPMDLEQIPRPNTAFKHSKEDPDATITFRSPSPGSQTAVRMPSYNVGAGPEGNDPYNVSHYTRDTTNRDEDPALRSPELEALKLAMLPPDDERVIEAKAALAEGPGSSPGNKGRFATGQTNYDPEGLRATMSTNHEALTKSLDANMPDHLPEPDWVERGDEIVQWYKERDLPVPMGGTGWGTIPTKGRIARW
uniref:Uncharacterized protein n=1 Tax=Helicotheca tamesis TaxID=374047 RepID=A0A7S2HZB5_9STRA|mmetsp:Transcript_4011/g.5425  ORF Transcript_4011/g.5425 Transcript_4011/m.5425 type:complete len:275 (+) Transcript_4011:191-1015(+)